MNISTQIFYSKLKNCVVFLDALSKYPHGGFDYYFNRTKIKILLQSLKPCKSII